MEFDAPEVETQRSDEIDLTDQGSQSVGSKRKAGRPVTNAWDTFKKVPNPDPGKSKRNWMGVCQFCDCKIASGKVEDLRAHAANCKKATPDAQLAARVQQVKAGGGSGKCCIRFWHHRCEVQSTEVAFACLLCMLVQEEKTCARH